VPPLVSISGTVTYCTDPALPAVSGVTMTLTGPSPAPTSTPTDLSGNYTLSALTSGGNYVVTPTKAARVPGSPGIGTTDVIAAQRHFLQLVLLSGCKLLAADVSPAVPDGFVTTTDVIAIQRFFLALTTGIARTGQYKFTPVSRTYTGIVANQTAQNYDTLIYGDVASGFVSPPRPGGGPAQDAAGDSTSEVASTVAAVALPDVAIAQSRTNFTAAVTTSEIDATNKLVGFQGDFTFDERVVTFQSQPVSNAGLTGGNWNVSGNVLPGAGPIRTLRISAYSNDFAPLSGSGTLFNLNMTRVSQAAQGTQLIWAAPPDHFIFIDADLNTQKAGNAAPGSVTASGRRQ